MIIFSIVVVIQKQRFLRDVMDEAMSALDKDYIQSCGYKHFGLVLYALTFVHGVFNVSAIYFLKLRTFSYRKNLIV